MNFDLSEDEELLKALVERFVADRYDIDRRRAWLAEPAGFSAQNWAMLGELGIVAALLETDPDCGGLSATAVATIFEALGRGLVVEPLVENTLVAGRLFTATAPAGLQAAWRDDLASGDRRLALAHQEERSRPGKLWVETVARIEPDGHFRLAGAKLHVPAGAEADGYVVSARLAGSANDPAGLAFFLVPSDLPGLSRTTWRMADGSAAVSLRLNDVVLPQDHRLAADMDRLEAVQTFANLARAAEAIGIMERIFAETLDYLRTRRQFGQALASFQALQHRMAAQYAKLEQARGLLNLALVLEGKPGFAKAVQGARAFISPASVALGHDMMQFHGGMGVTDELSIGHGHKRLLVLSRWPDDPDTALDRYAGLAA